MATKKTSTQAKTKKTTKTTKASASRKASAKTTKTTAKAKVTKKTPLTSKATVKPARNAKKSASKGKTITFLTLRKLHIVSAVIFLLLAAVAAFIMSSASVPVSISYLAKDQLASDATTVFTPASQSIMDVEVRWLVVSLAVVSAVYSLLLLTKLEKRYREDLGNRVFSARWIAASAKSVIVVTTAALISGVTDLMTLKLVAGIMIITAALGWLTERQNANTTKPVWGAYAFSIFSGALPLILLASYAISTWVYGFVRYPWYVYAAQAVVLVSFVTFALLIASANKQLAKNGNYLNIEKKYVLAGLATNVAFIAVLIIGLQSV